jgi:hypothetical protein
VIDPGAIDLSFVPRPRADVAIVEIDGESVLAATVGDDEELLTHWLNATGTIVWQCLDGVVSLDELIADLAAAFGTDAGVIGDDVMRLTRALGAVGLLEGVTAQLSMRFPADAAGVEGLPLEADVPPFSRPDLDGRDFTLESWRGRRLLLVNWSPTCGHCSRIAGELAELQPALDSHDVELVLLAYGTTAENRALLETAGLTCTLLLYGSEPVDLFRGLGTPCAYLVDERGAIASGLALGAIQVPALARLAVDPSTPR